MSLKNPVTPPGIDPGTVWLVAKCLKHYATPGPQFCRYIPVFHRKLLLILPNFWYPFARLHIVIMQKTTMQIIFLYHHYQVEELQKYECATGFDIRRSFKSFVCNMSCGKYVRLYQVLLWKSVTAVYSLHCSYAEHCFFCPLYLGYFICTMCWVCVLLLASSEGACINRNNTLFETKHCRAVKEILVFLWKLKVCCCVYRNLKHLNSPPLYPIPLTFILILSPIFI
jgi:hypothetical protein